MLGDDGNQMQADGNYFPEFILGWTNGAKGVLMLFHNGKFMSTEAKCNCQHCNGHIAFPAEMAGQMFECPHCKLETLLFIPLTDKPAPQSAPSKKRISAILWIFGGALLMLPILFFIGYALFQTASKQVSKTDSTNNSVEIKTVVGALGWNLGDVLPINFQVETNDDICGISYNFDPPAEIGTYPLSECYLILTEDRRIAAICATGPENDHFNVLNFQKVLKEKYGLGNPPVWRDKDRGYSTYNFGQGNRRVVLTTMEIKESPLHIEVEYQDEQLRELVSQQMESRKAALRNQIQNNLKWKF